jgi:hypothetical protein
MKKITLVNSYRLLPTQIDIYSGEETLRFNNRHPIFKTLMKLEFEEVLRSFSKRKPEIY